MKSILAFIFFLAAMFASQAMAQSITLDLSQLSPEAKAALDKAKLLPVQPAAAANADTSVTVGVLKEIRLMGESIGTGLMSAAEKLGMAATAFLNSDIGKITAGLLFWKYFGSLIMLTLLSILLPIPFFFFAFKAVKLCQNDGMSIRDIESFEVATKPVLFGLWTREYKTNIKYGPLQDTGVSAFLCAIVTVVLFITWAIAVAHIG